jgi:hypothetical protein
MRNPQAVFSVVENVDLMMIIASFLVDSSSKNNDLVLCDRMIPLMLSFRSLYTRMMLKLRESMGDMFWCSSEWSLACVGVGPCSGPSMSLG